MQLDFIFEDKKFSVVESGNVSQHGIETGELAVYELSPCDENSSFAGQYNGSYVGDEKMLLEMFHSENYEAVSDFMICEIEPNLY